MRDRPTKDSRPFRPSRGSPDRGHMRKEGAPPPRGEASPRAAANPSNKFAARARPAHKGPAKGRSLKKEPVRAPDPEQSPDQGGAQRIAKVMARAGLCSRRTAESWIGGGRVALNGALVTDPAVNVAAADKITVDGEPLAARARTRLFLFHKPRGLVSTDSDPEGRPTIFDYLREHWPDGPRVVSIGRLDINTEGLLLLTNDGGLARVLELPATGWVRRYRVRAKGETDQAVLDSLRDGIVIDGVNYAGIEATLDREQGANSWMTLALREGKNREIKRVLEHFGLVVNRLIRLSFGPFQLGELAEGAVEEVRQRVLRDQLGPSLAKAAGVDFSSPAPEPPEPPQEIERRRPTRAAEARPRAGGGLDQKRAAPRNGRATKPGVKQSRERTPSAEPKVKPSRGPRKHISALRAEERATQSGARKRIERRETEDRNGRTIQIERLVPAEARQGKPGPAATRNGRRFDAERKSRDDEAAPTGKGSRVEKRSHFEKPGGQGARGPSGKSFEGRSRPTRPPGKTEGERPARHGAASARRPASATEGEREGKRTRFEKPDARGAREPSAKVFEGRSRPTRPPSKTEGERPARHAAASASRPASASDGLRDRQRTRREKPPAQGAREPAAKRFEARPRPAAPKGETQGRRPDRPGGAAAGGKPSAKGGPARGAGPARGGGPGKGRPRDKR